MSSELKMTWREIESAIDWLMHESSLSLGYSLREPTIKNQRSSQIAKYRQDSTAYLTRLGLNQVSAWNQTSQGLTYGTIPITGLTVNELLLLEKLFTKRNVTVTYDELADTLWPNGKNFSLFAISKEVERLRRKLYELGIHTPVILAHRKVGYSLV